jgi:LRR receptor-like serine/threonine-protein kinase FLS2
LTYLNINFNEGTWAFPSEIRLGEESSLETIGAESTKLSGLLPTFTFASDAHKLKVINLRGNSLQGPIPDTIGSIRSLEYLSLHENQLNGTLPSSVSGLTNITVIALGKNLFEGSIPSSFGKLDKLQVLDLSHNRLEGPIPDTFSQLSSLEHVSLQGNANLNGSRSAFESLDRLSSLMLYGNSFSGVLPEGLFSSYTGEIWADLGHNNFTGKMPESFSQFAANTTYLSIMQNDFDEDAVDDATCEEAGLLFADCDTCTCCKIANFCCEGGSSDDKRLPPCHFEVDFFTATGLNCNIWWQQCRAPVSYNINN